jgi:hypothetical protein
MGSPVWRTSLVALVGGAASALWTSLQPCSESNLLAKAVPAGKPLESVKLKGFAGNPRTTIVSTILNYYDIPHTHKEYNSLTNDNVYTNIPVAQFLHTEFEWVQTHGMDHTVSQLALLCLNRGLTPTEEDWHAFVRSKLCPALEYTMWRSFSSTLEQLQYFGDVNTVSNVRRVIHPLVCGVVLPFRKCRQLRKMYKVNSSSLGTYMQEVQQILDGQADAFLGGRRPGFSDLEVFGALQAVRNTSVEKDILSAATPRFRQWYDVMKDEVYAGDIKEFSNKLAHLEKPKGGIYKW